MEVHADPAPSKRNAFDRQSYALLLTFLTKEGDPAAGTHDAMPRQTASTLQRPNREPCGAREARSRRRLTIRDYFPPRHASNHFSDPLDP